MKLILPLLFLSMNVFSQNLLVNGDFEEYTTSCEFLEDFIGLSNPNTATPDFYHLDCGTVPASIFSSGKYPYSGNGLAAFLAFSDTIDFGWREYIQYELASILEANTLYTFKFMLSLADLSGAATSNIGIALSNSQVMESGGGRLNLVTVWDNPKDSLLTFTEWREMRATFKAKGGERFLIIGNFSQAADINHVKAYPDPNYSEYSYYYIDRSTLEVAEPELYTPNVFTPNGDGINDIWNAQVTGTSVVRWKIYSRWGNLVYAVDGNVCNWNGKANNEGRECPDGTYFFVCEYGQDTSKEFKSGIIHLFR